MRGGRFLQRAAFTLLELLVAMGIMIALGTALMLVLRGGLSTWTTGEARRESSQIAQVVFGALREDLQSTTIYRQKSGKSSNVVNTRFLCIEDINRTTQGKDVIESYRQQLFLVRTIKAESENPVTGTAGSVLNAQGIVDLHADKAEALERDLRATGGLMEVGYARGFKDSKTLYRMVRAPIGGDQSLFGYPNLPVQFDDPAREQVVADYQERLVALEGVKSVRRANAKIYLHTDGSVDRDTIFQQLETMDWYKGKFQEDMDREEMDLDVIVGADEVSVEAATKDTKLETWGKPLASNVLFLGYEFWHDYTVGWNEQERPFEGRREHGAIPYWDSTRGFVNPRVDNGFFTLFKGAGSQNDPTDDVLPARVRITLVLEEPSRAGTETELLTDITDSSDTFTIREPGRAPKAPGHILIENEWIRYSEINGDEITVDTGGRGARGTIPTAHSSGQPALLGRQYQVVIPIPGYSEDWND
ncbi:MAG: type II secretion system protein [Planctomycetota bacterium]|nr:type II secretion system protein [Planctomycetota bacterium]